MATTYLGEHNVGQPGTLAALGDPCATRQKEGGVILLAAALALVIGLVLLLVISILVRAAWIGADLPPPDLLVRYGCPPKERTTGNVHAIDVDGDRIEFAEVCPGYTPVRQILEPNAWCRALRACLGPSFSRHPPERQVWLSVREPFWISHRIVEESLRRIPALPGNRLFHLPAWLTVHAPGSFRFATIDESCMGHAAGVCAEYHQSTESARVDRDREDVWITFIPRPRSRDDATGIQWRRAFRSVDSSWGPSWPDARLLDA